MEETVAELTNMHGLHNLSKLLHNDYVIQVTTLFSYQKVMTKWLGLVRFHFLNGWTKAFILRKFSLQIGKLVNKAMIIKNYGNV